MSNGYLVAASADVATAREIGEGFGLDVIDAGTIGDTSAIAAALSQAPNVGIVLSSVAGNDEAYVALLQTLASALQRAQLIVIDTDAPAAFSFLPSEWPVMSLDDARTRAAALAAQRQPSEPSSQPHTEDQAPAPSGELDGAPEEDQAASDEPAPVQDAPEATTEAEPEEALLGGAESPERVDAPAEESIAAGDEPAPEAERTEEAPAASEAPPPSERDEVARGIDIEPSAPPIAAAPPQAPPAAEPPAPAAPAPAARKTTSRDDAAAPAPVTDRAMIESAPADATAFAPKKLRRGTPELVRIVVHQPKDLNAVIKAAKKMDPRAEPAPSGMSIGDVALGASIGVALEVRGASCDGTLQRRVWGGEPIDFAFSVEADPSVKQVVIIARVFVDDAQIGVVAFTRNVSGPAKKPHGLGDRVRLKRHKRVFLSYSSKDRETVATIATAYQMAGVEHFWDRTSLKSGETWHPRLRREIDRADLFHLCWSRAAAESEWVKKEAEHAITRRKRHSGKPDITVQMLDGPPWAKHPEELDSINFDDFVRAAIVGYARGDGS